MSLDSAVMFAACFLTLETYWSWMERRLALMILTVALIDPAVSVSPFIPLDICRDPAEWLQSKIDAPLPSPSMWKETENVSG